MRWTPWPKLGPSMFYGLLAAFGWGAADLTAAISGRRIGSFLTAGFAQAASLVALVVMGLAMGQHLGATGGEATILFVNGVFAAAAYLALYRSLEVGPVALVSPIVAAYAAITIVLAMVLLHEELVGIALAGTIVTLVGVVFTAADLKLLRSGSRLISEGVAWALVSMLLFGVATFVLGRYSQRIGWYSASLLSRVGNVAGVLAVVWFGRRRFLRKVGSSDVTIAAFVGLADMLGVVAYARGTELGLVSVVSAASAAFILIPVLGGLLLYKERPAVSQAAGVAMVGAGLVMLGLG